jgi:transcriptional regulator with XRE-family HTH domain
MSIGKNVKLFRINAGLKQKQLATTLDIEVSYLSAIENDKKEPSLSLLRRISNQLNVPISIFFWNDSVTDGEASPPDDLKQLIFELAKKTSAHGTLQKLRE